ncbi:Hpt domain-containing protein [Zoogloea sp.]|uniref:Hpt domain-containing protein n=1 Tax=Zoogloea sp. TaxID=49181 RepID=UPI0035B2ACA0
MQSPPASPAPGFPQPIDGLDIASGLRRMEGDPVLYLALLRDFIATERSAASAIAAALAAGDRPAATRRAHTVKGLSGTFGAFRLQPAALDLEMALREDRPLADVHALLAHFRHALDALMAELDARLPPEATPAPVAPGPVDDAQLAAVCRELLPLVVACDLAALHLADTHAELLGRAFGSDFQAIRQALHNFDFEIAETALIAACHTHGYPPPSA